MRPERGRTKKLIVAFHFHSNDQAGWKCEPCRAKGLETKRRCGWSPDGQNTPVKVIWARHGVTATSCPKSYISAESLSLIEEYYAWKLLGPVDFRTLSARQVDAFCILEREAAKDNR